MNVYSIIFDTVADQGKGATTALTTLWSWFTGTPKPQPEVPRAPTPHETRMAQSHMLLAWNFHNKPLSDMQHEFQITFHLHKAATELAKARKLDPTAKIEVDINGNKVPLGLDQFAAILCNEEASIYYAYARQKIMENPLEDVEFITAKRKYLRERKEELERRIDIAAGAIDCALSLFPDNLHYIHTGMRVYKLKSDQHPRYHQLRHQAESIDPYNTTTLEIVA